MHFQLTKNHIILDVATDIGHAACVLDTGSPFTFFFNSAGSYTIDGETRAVTPNLLAGMMANQREPIENLIGTRIDGIIGSDFMSAGGEVYIDFPRSEVFFGAERIDGSRSVAMQSILGLPVFNVSFGGVEVAAGYDTGAMHPFVTQSLLQSADLTPTERTFEDFNPMLGSFEPALYRGNIAVGGADLGEKDIAISPAYDDVCAMLGVQAFVGNSALRDHAICLSYRTQRVEVVG